MVSGKCRERELLLVVMTVEESRSLFGRESGYESVQAFGLSVVSTSVNQDIDLSESNHAPDVGSSPFLCQRPGSNRQITSQGCRDRSRMGMEC